MKDILKTINSVNKIIDKNMDKKTIIDIFFNRIIDSIKVELPKPEVDASKDKKDAFEDYRHTLDDNIEVFISDETIDSNLIGDDIDLAKHLKI